MARQPEMRDRFRITAEVESEALGPLLAQLARMGLQNLGYELITDVMNFKTRGPWRRLSAPSMLRAWLSEHPIFSRVEALSHCEENGVGKVAASSAVQTLLGTGEIVPISHGEYRRVDKALPPPDAPGATKTRGGNREFLWTEFKDRQHFVPADVAKFFKTAGRPGKSASALLSLLTKEGFFTRTKDGVYSPVKKKGLPYTPRPSTGMNGQGASHV